MSDSINESNDISRIMREDDIIDTLFTICDQDDTGYVPASQFIKYISSTTNYNREGKTQLEFLHKVLDPSGIDALIDLETCRTGFTSWIHKIRHNSDEEEGKNKTNGNKKSNENKNSLDDLLLEETDHKLAETLREVDELKHRNKVLRDLNGALQAQLETADDLSSQQNGRVSELNVKVAGLQQFIEQCQKENADYVAALCHLDKLREESKELKEMHQSDKHELYRLGQLLDQRDKENGELNKTLQHQKTMWTYTKDMHDMKDNQLKEQTINFAEMQNYINELKKKIEDLKDEKCLLEGCLCETNHELDRLKRNKYEQYMPDVCGSPSMTSLRMELRDQLDKIPHLPSPLCEREDGCKEEYSIDSPTPLKLNSTDPQIYTTVTSPFLHNLVKDNHKISSLKVSRKKRRIRHRKLPTHSCNLSLDLPSLHGFVGQCADLNAVTSTPSTSCQIHNDHHTRCSTPILSDDSLSTSASAPDKGDNCGNASLNRGGALIYPMSDTPATPDVVQTEPHPLDTQTPDPQPGEPGTSHKSDSMTDMEVVANDQVFFNYHNVFSTASQLRKIREDRIFRKKQASRHLKMPDLTEMTENHNNNNSNNAETLHAYPAAQQTPDEDHQKVEFQITLDTNSIAQVPANSSEMKTHPSDESSVDSKRLLSVGSDVTESETQPQTLDETGAPKRPHSPRNDANNDVNNDDNNDDDEVFSELHVDDHDSRDVSPDESSRHGADDGGPAVPDTDSIVDDTETDDSRVASPAETVIDEPDDMESTYSSAFPSIPQSFLQQLGLVGQADAGEDTTGFDDLTPEEIEEKFSSLSLAYKTDLQTLEQRLDVQRRARDRAEQNVDKEILDLHDIHKILSTGDLGQELLARLHEGILDLKQSLSRVSGDAEVLGAVEQEGRLSKAMELMIMYVDHLKRKHEKEHSELDEARQLLHMNNIISGGLGPSDAFQLHKRAYSITPVTGLKGPRRRNSVAVLPRMSPGLGGVGGGSISPLGLNFANMGLPLELIDSRRELVPLFTEDVDFTKDDKRDSKIGGRVRKTSQERLVGLPLRSVRRGSDSGLPVPCVKPRDSPVKQDSIDMDTCGGNKQKEDEAFQRGFAQGIRAHLGRELTDLRSQQQCFSQKLDDLMDETDDLSDEDVSRPCRESLSEWFSRLRPELEWQLSSDKMRATTSLCVLFLALLCALYTLLPHTSGLDISPNIKYDRSPPS